jgi:hypothetical protein
VRFTTVNCHSSVGMISQLQTGKDSSGSESAPSLVAIWMNRQNGSGKRENAAAQIGTIRHNRAKPSFPSTLFVSRRAVSSYTVVPCSPLSTAATSKSPSVPISHRPELVPPGFPKVTPSNFVDVHRRLVPLSFQIARAATTSLASRSLNAVASKN